VAKTPSRKNTQALINTPAAMLASWASNSGTPIHIKSKAVTAAK